MTYSLIHAINLIYEHWVTLGQDNIYTCTVTQSDSQVCKLFILIITVACESARMLFCFSRSSVKFKGHRGQKSTPTCACWWLNAARLHYNSIANVENHYTPAQRSWWEGILDSPCPSVCPSFCRWHVMVSGAQLKFALEFKFHIHVVCGYGQKPIDFQRCHFQNLPPGGYIGFSVSGL